MRQFIDLLESRCLFSTAFLTDQSAIVSDAAALKVAVKSLATQDKTFLAAITTDLKKLPKTNASLLANVKTDATNLAKATAADGTALTTPSGKLVKTAVTVADKLLSSWTPAAEITVATDSTNLNSIIVAPLGQLQLDLTGPLITNLGVILTVNPTATQLASDIAALDAGYAAAAAQLTGAASQYQTGISTLASDLGSIPAFPNILFNYSGSAKDTTPGKKFGKSFKLTFDIIGEDTNGSWTATYTDTSKKVLTSEGATGTVDASGDFIGMLDDGTTISGTVNGKKITGTVAGIRFDGTFSAAHT